MNWQEKFFNLFTICEKSGKLVKGFDISKETVSAGKAACVMVTADVSAKTLKEVSFMCRNFPDLPVVNLPFSMDDIKHSIGRKAGVMAVCDKGFADKLTEYALAASKE